MINKIAAMPQRGVEKKTFLIVALALLAIALAGFIHFKPSRYVVYKCKTGMAKFCTTDRDICKPLESGTEMEFLIDRSSKSVSQITYYRSGSLANMPPSSLTYENCKIFDEKNWDCTESETFASGVSSEHIKKMVKGVYFYSFFNGSGTNRPDPNTYLDYCAK